MRPCDQIRPQIAAPAWCRARLPQSASVTARHETRCCGATRYGHTGTDGGAGSVVAMMLLRRGTGRRRITRALTRRFAEDADLVALFTDDEGIPVAIGDRYSPISGSLHRAVLARDQGCRSPGCTTPAGHCDLHHVIPRHADESTSMDNLVAVCQAPSHRTHPTSIAPAVGPRRDPNHG